MNLDHVGIATRDLDKGAAALKRIGFRLTPRSHHSGSVTPGGPVEKWGSANECAMLRHGYIEMLGLTDPSLHSSAKALLAKYEGTHIVAFGCESAAITHPQLQARGAKVNKPITLERKVPFGTTGSEERTARFLNMYADPAIYPEAKFIVIEHVTPEVLWQEHFLDHPNGALALTEVYICSASPNETLEKIGAITGSAISGDTVPLNPGKVFVFDPAHIRERIPDCADLPVPFVAGFGIGVQNIDETRSYLNRQDVRLTATENRLWVSPDDTCGAAISFAAA